MFRKPNFCRSIFLRMEIKSKPTCQCTATRYPPPNFDEIMNVGRKAIVAFEGVYGTKYVVGPTSTTLYYHSGASQDWAKDVAGIKYTYTVELRDTGNYGFLLPPAQILPTSIETWTAVQVVAREVMNEA